MTTKSKTTKSKTAKSKTATKSKTAKDVEAKSGARKPGATKKEDFSYDASKDKVVKEIGLIETGTRAGNIVVRVVSYNGGDNKLLVARTGTSKKTGEAWFTPKLGRLTKDELDAVIPLMTKGAKYL